MDHPPTAHRYVLPDVVALEGHGEYGYREFAYAVVLGDISALIDVTDARLIPQLEGLPAPRFLLLTHRHTRRDEARFEAEFGLAVYLHPHDARAPRGGPSATTPPASDYVDPFGDAALAQHGFRFLHVPGHTPGGTAIVWERRGGVLFTGDSVVGPKHGEPPHLAFPPPVTSDDDPTLRASVRALPPPAVQSVLPLHGDPVLADSADAMSQLWADLVAAPA